MWGGCCFVRCQSPALAQSRVGAKGAACARLPAICWRGRWPRWASTLIHHVLRSDTGRPGDCRDAKTCRRVLLSLLGAGDGDGVLPSRGWINHHGADGLLPPRRVIPNKTARYVIFPGLSAASYIGGKSTYSTCLGQSQGGFVLGPRHTTTKRIPAIKAYWTCRSHACGERWEKTSNIQCRQRSAQNKVGHAHGSQSTSCVVTSLTCDLQMLVVVWR